MSGLSRCRFEPRLRKNGLRVLSPLAPGEDIAAIRLLEPQSGLKGRLEVVVRRMHHHASPLRAAECDESTGFQDPTNFDFRIMRPELRELECTLSPVQYRGS